MEASKPGGDSRLEAAVQVAALDLRFVQAPTYSLAIAADDAGADAQAPPPSGPVQTAVTGDFDGDGDIDVVTCAHGER